MSGYSVSESESVRYSEEELSYCVDSAVDSEPPSELAALWTGCGPADGSGGDGVPGPFIVPIPWSALQRMEWRFKVTGWRLNVTGYRFKVTGWLSEDSVPKGPQRGGVW